MHDGTGHIRWAVLLFWLSLPFVVSDASAQARSATSSSGSPEVTEDRRDTTPRSAPGTARARASETRNTRAKAAGALVGHGGPIKAVKVDIGGRRALTGSFDYAMMLWDIGGEKPRVLHRLDAHEGAVNAVAFVPDSHAVLSAGDDGSVWLWDGKTGSLIRRFTGHTAKINALAVSVDGRWAASASWDRTARLWDLKELRAGPVLEGHKGLVNAVTFSADGETVFTASVDGSIAAWDRMSGTYRRPVVKHGWGLNVLERLPGKEDRLLYGALNGYVGVVDARTGNTVATLKAHDRPVLSLSVIEKPGLVATGGGDGVIRVYRLDDWQPIEEYANPYGPIWALSFLADGGRLYYAGLDDFATLWQVSPRKPFEIVQSAFPRRFQVSPQGDDPISQGERQFARKCSVCHTLDPDGGNRAGPTLFNVYGRRAGTLPGYPYSDALKNADIVWNDDTIGKLFALGPDVYTPGSKMPLQRMTDETQRDALLAYLKASGGLGSRTPTRTGVSTKEGKTQ